MSHFDNKLHCWSCGQDWQLSYSSSVNHFWLTDQLVSCAADLSGSFYLLQMNTVTYSGLFSVATVNIFLSVNKMLHSTGSIFLVPVTSFTWSQVLSASLTSRWWFLHINISWQHRDLLSTYIIRDVTANSLLSLSVKAFWKWCATLFIGKVMEKSIVKV